MTNASVIKQHRFTLGDSNEEPGAVRRQLIKHASLVELVACNIEIGSGEEVDGVFVNFL